MDNKRTGVHKFSTSTKKSNTESLGTNEFNKRASKATVLSRTSVAPSVISRASTFRPLQRKSRKTKKAKTKDHTQHPVNQGHPTKTHKVNVKLHGIRVSHSSTTGNFGTDCFLRIPRKIRIKVWRYLTFQDILHLRLTCRSIKKDIDGSVGVKVELDDIDESFPHLIQIGIQCAIILDILSVHGQFLRHPELLKDLQIMGGVTAFTFTQMLLDCENITHLTIQFNKELCNTKPKLFPLDLPKNSRRKILPHLKFLKIEANMKTDQDLRYVKSNFIGLIQKHLLRQVRLQSIHVSITHRGLADIISECSHTMAIFVCDNCHALKDLHSEIKLVQIVNIVDEFLKSKEVGGQLTFMDVIRAEKCPESQNPSWDSFSRLEVVHFASGPRDFSCYWDKMVPKLTNVVTLSLEIQSPVSWNYYKHFIEANSGTLKAVRLLECDNFGPGCQPLDINIGLFHKCKHLEALVIVQSKCSGNGSKLTHISSLPSSIKELELSWLILDWPQAIRLARLPRMQSLKLGYFSPSNTSFGRVLFFLRWAYTCGCSRVNEFTIVDHKIRYQQNKRALDALLNHKTVKAQYVDYDETLLELRRVKAS